MSRTISLKSRHVARVVVTAVLVLLLTVSGTYGQADSTRNFKNTVRINLTNPVLFSWKFNVMGYERVIKDYQTASINIGRTAFPTFSYMADSLGLRDLYNDKGFNFSVDYRFYLQNENKHRAPRGVYIGPYYSFNHFSRDIDWDVNTTTFQGDVTTSFNINANFIGFQLGYQFVFWDRMTLDMVLLGPGWWHFNLHSKFDTTLAPEDEEMLLDTLNELLKEKFPDAGFVFTGEGFDLKSSTTSDMLGMRYMINIGFRF